MTVLSDDMPGAGHSCGHVGQTGNPDLLNREIRSVAAIEKPVKVIHLEVRVEYREYLIN